MGMDWKKFFIGFYLCVYLFLFVSNRNPNFGSVFIIETYVDDLNTSNVFFYLLIIILLQII
jgi:hypothetical protein